MASPAYFEIIDFIAAGTTPGSVGGFRPSREAQGRVAELLEREIPADVAEGSGSIRSESLRAGQDDAGFPQLKGSDIASVDAATGEVLRFNAAERVIERNILLALGRYA